MEHFWPFHTHGWLTIHQLLTTIQMQLLEYSLSSRNGLEDQSRETERIIKETDFGRPYRASSSLNLHHHESLHSSTKDMSVWISFGRQIKKARENLNGPKSLNLLGRLSPKRDLKFKRHWTRREKTQERGAKSEQMENLLLLICRRRAQPSQLLHLPTRFFTLSGG